MNELQPLTKESWSPEAYHRCVWALVTAGIVSVFFFLTWLSIQHAKLLLAEWHSREAEQRTVVVEKQRDAAVQERLARTGQLNEKISGLEAARVVVENEAREMVTTGTRQSLPARTESPAPLQELVRAVSAGPNAQELSAFIKEHLAHMTEAVETELPDYADEVDFHDKPHASIRAIENDRRQWAQKYPVRVIFKDNIQPQFTAVRDAGYGWIATAKFDWQFQFRSRSGAVMRGVSRDTWKIVPSAQGLKIISEHSADPVTGALKE